MPKRTVSCAAKCPYYKGEDRHEIYCDGLQEQSAIHVAFASPAKRKDWEQNYCKSISGCTSCSVYRMLKAKDKAEI